MKKKPSLISYFNNLPLDRKLSTITAVAVLIPLVITLLLLGGRIQRMVTAETIRDEQVQTAKAAPVLSGVFNEIIAASRKIKSGELSRGEAASGPVTAVCQYVDLPEDDPFFTRPENKGFAPMNEIKGTYWYGIMRSGRQPALFCPPRYLGVKEREKYADCSYVTNTLISDEEHGAMSSYLVLYFSSETLSNILKDNQTYSGSVSYIANERDEMAASTDPVLSGIYYMDYDSIQNSVMSSNGFLERDVLDETVYVSYFYLAPADWYLVTVTPDTPLKNQAASVMLFITFIYLAATAAALFISITLARSIARRIGSVSRQMSSARSGLPVPIETPHPQDEVGDLVESYNFMVRQINHFIEDQANAAEELRVAEFRSLQAQINPHFLFNTMEMINQLASTGNTQKTNEAITALSRFYRLTLSRKEAMCTIGDEVEHISVYIRIQNMRFDDGIDFVTDIPDELLDYQIPRITLQPIVENSILHGILERPDRRGTIVLTGWIENEDVVLLLSDNGVGMSRERMEQILTGKLADGKGMQIAVINTHRRLQIAYGKNYGLSYSSTPGAGTDVTIRIAAVKAEPSAE